MAISLGFGVLAATAITLILVPTLYRVLEDVKSWFGVGAEEARVSRQLRSEEAG
jgi:hypothetical protein